MRVLVAYATAEGSTAGVAERIGAVLRNAGHQVAVRPVEGIDAIRDYDAVVLGSAVHDQQWLPAATAFLARERLALAGRPLWAFSVGMPDAFRGRPRQWVLTEADDLLDDLLLHVEPKDHRLFSGVTRPAQFAWWRRPVFRLAGGRYGDFRDWAAIDGWARSIVHALAGTPAEG
ncbi:flavodoxin domain-containing protein [Actinosynnema sp. NPDC059335]|uniref:flavodoxin domain-containing protein n=1 Tax=Actinosynnema sp. NPDC059335 TaxID=3346804 RepID=UPI00366F3216